MLPSRGLLRSASAQRQLASRAVWRTVGGSRQQFGTLGRVTSSPSLLSRTRQYAAPAAMGTIASTRNLSVWGYRIPYTGGSSEPKPVVPEPQPQTAAEASTTTAAEATPPAAPPSSAESFIPESGLSEISEMVNNPDFLNMPEGIGYLKSMGLDFGWGVTSTMGWVLEHVHIWGNLSWGGSIVATAVLLRVAFFWPFLKSTRFNHRMKLMQEDPRHVENTKKMQEAARSGDRQAQQEVFGLNKLLRQEYNAPISGILWGFLPIPFSIGFFRILNSMAKLPVPGMETGGFAWFQDLTVADPYYILPATATCFMVGTLVIGSRQSTAAQRAMMKKAGYVMVPIMFFVTSYLSAGVNLMGAAFGAATLVTTTMMSVNPIRRVFGVPDLRAPQPAIPTTATYEPPRPAPASPAYTPQGMKERLTTNYDDLKKTVGDGMSSMTGKYSETEADKAERKRKEMIKKIEAKRLDQEREHFNRKFKGGNK